MRGGFNSVSGTHKLPARELLARADAERLSAAPRVKQGQNREMWRMAAGSGDLRPVAEFRPRRQRFLIETDDMSAFLAHQLEAGRPQLFAAQAHDLLAELDVLDQLRMSVEMQQRREPAIERSRLGEAAGLAQRPQ